MGAKKQAAMARRTSKTKTKKTLYFTASWCPPCQAMHRMLHDHPELMERVELIDIDENEALAKKHGIRAVPTFVRPDGERKVGGMPLAQLRAFLRAT